MLTITLPEIESYTETGGFVTHQEMKLRLEHSLYAVSLWESKWKKSFLDTLEKGMSPSGFLYYISCMPINADEPSGKWLARLTEDHLIQIRDYISDPMTATTINGRKLKPGKKQIITSEIIYFWMTQYNIPFECDRWNFSRLLTLIEVATIKSGSQPKMSQKEAMRQQQAICEANRRKYNSRG